MESLEGRGLLEEVGHWVEGGGGQTLRWPGPTSYPLFPDREIRAGALGTWELKDTKRHLITDKPH